MTAAQHPTVRKQYLGAQLKQLREKAQIKREVVAERLGCWDTKISRIEKGLTAPRKVDLEIMLDLYGVEDEEVRGALFALTRNSRKKDWWHQHDEILSPSEMDRISLEADAAKIFTFQTVLIPGLFQTKEYALALNEGVGVDLAATERFVSVRMERQRILEGPDAPQLVAVLDEAAIRRTIGGPPVMAAQLRHLVALSNPPKLSIQVVPFDAGAHPGIDGPFFIYSYAPPVSLDVVLLEQRDSRLYLEGEEQVQTYRMSFDHLRTMALSSRQSKDLILRLAHDLESR
ncbi:helix-turn-helix domain-containing protein [Streptomyces sp. NBC_01262]|uniref:helix-turn-helix domain-containing protein n=1 Tax=Streptomyces sp. NBC_01262 TaxID=2903803 RepID=UPI002E3017DE|nr:helix-turn-helix transcriptional regulator [Streptomyces sp. NBC_01262]